MTDSSRQLGSELSPLGEWLFASVFWVVGIAILALAAGVIPASPTHFHSPRWVLGAMGLAFFCGGFAPMSDRSGPDSVLTHAVCLVLVCSLAAVFNWGAFGAGPRQFSGGMSIGGFATPSDPASESDGRAFFGVTAIVLDLMAAVIAYKWFRARQR